MSKSKKTAAKVLQFPVHQAPVEQELEKWFRGIMNSHEYLISALEQLRDSYKALIAGKASTDAHQAVLMAVEITLRNARNARVL
jgi:hypothetical protein